MAGAQRALTVVSIVLLVLGVVLLGWAIAPNVEGFDGPKVELDKSLTGPAGQNFTKTPFATLQSSGGTYRLEVDSKAQFTIGQRRADRDGDAIAQTGANSYNAGGDTRYYWSEEWQGTIRSDAPSAPDAGPMVYFIKFPGATTPQTFHALALFTPTASVPFVFLKTWASISGLVITAFGLILFLVRAAMQRPRAETGP